MGSVVPRKPLTMERVMSRVDTKPGLGPYGDCWEWTGSTSGIGYGNIGWVVDGRYRVVKVHRVVLSLCGLLDLTDRHQVGRHKCDNPACCRPSHLTVGSFRDNARDRTSRGRDGRAGGRKAGGLALTVKQVLDIRSSPLSNASLADQYGLSRGFIGKVRRGVCYADVQ